MSDDTGGFSAPPPPPPPPSAGGGGSLPQRGLGDILSTAFDVYKANASKLIVIVAIIVVPLTFLSSLFSNVVFAGNKTTTTIGNTTLTTTSRSIGVIVVSALLVALISWVIGALLQAAVIRGAALATLGDPVDVEASYKFGFRKIGSVILISLLVGLVVVAGFLLFIIPVLGWIAGIAWFIFASTMLSMAIASLVVEDRRGTDAMSRSWNLVKGHFWHALGVIVVAAIIAGIVAGLISAIGGGNWILGWIFGAIGTIITAPFTALVTVILYLDLRSRSESLTAETLRSDLAHNA